MPLSVSLDAVLTGLVFTVGAAVGGGGFWLGRLQGHVADLRGWKKAVEESDREDRAEATDVRIAISEFRGEMKGYFAAITAIIAGERADVIEAAARIQEQAPPYQPRPPRRRNT